EIDLMAEGSDKKIAQIKLNYTKEIAEIVAQEEKWKAAQEGELTDEQTVEITKAKTSAKSQAEKDTADVTATELAENKKKINALLEQYQTLDQKRKAIDSAYAKDKTALETELKRLQDTGEDTTNVEASLEARETAYKNSIKSLQSEIVQSTEFYNKLFSSFSDKGYTVLKDFYKEAKNVIESAVVSGDSVTVAIPELTEDGSIVEKQVKITVAEYQKMVNQLVSMGDELEKDNPFKAVYNSFSDMLTAIKEGDTDAFSNSMESLQSAVDSTVGTMSQWGDSLETIFGDTVGQAFDEIVQLTEGVLDLGIGIGQIYSGDVIGGITSVLSGIASIVECLTSWREKEEEQQRSWYLAELEVNRLLEERNYELAESRNTIADILADTEALAWLVKNGFAAESSSSEWSSAMSAFEEANSNLESEMARYEELWDKVQSSNAEWSGKSGSLSWYSVTQSLKGMTEAEIELYYQQGKLSDSAEDYYEAWVESGESIEELMDTIDELYASMREMVMGVSFDGWLSNAASALQSMQSDISALGDFTEETLTDALLNAFMYQRLADVLESLYNELSDALIDGSADADFISDWKEQFEEIMSDASDEYAALADAMGISSSTTQSGNSGSFETMSQDQGTKLEGLFTAAEIHLDSIDDNVVEIKDDIEEVSIQMSNATGYLKTIAENTTESKTTLADLYTTFKKMISDGLKIK
ncbi:MAG: tail tape measure protein, partial [Rikenellaceae bacterium]